jgi:hypothetical protein
MENNELNFFECPSFGDLYVTVDGTTVVYHKKYTLPDGETFHVLHQEDGPDVLVGNNGKDFKNGKQLVSKCLSRARQYNDCPTGDDMFDYKTIKELPSELSADYDICCKFHFKMTSIEYARFRKFQELHRHEGVDRGAIGGGVSVSFMPTSLGNVVKCECHICGQTTDITNVDNW